jgi:geranylgeranyl pyrophosphate synthase
MREAKKTLLIWYAYNNCGKTDKRTIKKIFSKRNAGLADLLKLRKIISRSGSLDHAKNEIAALLRKAAKLNSLLKIPSAYRNSLSRYTQRLLSL